MKMRQWIPDEFLDLLADLGCGFKDPEMFILPSNLDKPYYSNELFLFSIFEEVNYATSVLRVVELTALGISEGTVGIVFVGRLITKV